MGDDFHLPIFIDNVELSLIQTVGVLVKAAEQARHFTRGTHLQGPWTSTQRLPWNCATVSGCMNNRRSGRFNAGVMAAFGSAGGSRRKWRWRLARFIVQVGSAVIVKAWPPQANCPGSKRRQMTMITPENEIPPFRQRTPRFLPAHSPWPRIARRGGQRVLACLMPTIGARERRGE